MRGSFYSPENVKSVLENYLDIQCGIDPDPSCIETTGRSSKHIAPYVNWCEVAGEVACRVELCGKDGLVVRYRYGLLSGATFTEEAVAKGMHITVDDVRTTTKRVVNYCAGRRRGWHKDRQGVYRPISYDEWLHDKRFSRVVRA